MLEAHLTQVRLELLGEDHRHGGVGPLPHLDLVHDQRHLAGAVDTNERVGSEFAGRRGGRGGRELLREGRGQAEADE